MALCLMRAVLRPTAARIRSLTAHSRTLLPTAVLDDLGGLELVIWKIFEAFDYDEGLSGRDQTDQLWLDELKEIVYCVEDVVAECSYEVLQAAVRRKNQISTVGSRPHSKTSLASYPGAKPVISDDLAGRLREVVLKIVEITRKLESFLPEEKLRKPVPGTRIPPATSLLRMPPIFGREQEKEIIVGHLLSEDSSAGSVSVLPIVGMAGVGKTTLAQQVYNDFTISRNFDLRGWVNVSEDFCITTITRNILQSFRKKECSLKDQTRLQKELVKELMGKSFFIILDDVYYEDESLWMRFLAPFLYAQTGKIVITTRNACISIVRTMPQFFLKNLTCEDCWSLFQTSASRSPGANSRRNLLEIGRKIVAECGGIPLFVKAVASALKFENDKQKWVCVLESDLLDSSSSSEVIFSTLKICYECMPLMLKQCFLFLAMYPNGHVFFKDDLIRLWMYVGLLEEEGKELADVGWMSVGLLKEKGKDPLDVGSLVFDELVERTMFEPAYGVYGRNDGFLVHSLVHDLARSVAGKEFAVVKHYCLHDISSDVRYLSIILPDLPKTVDLQPLKKCKNLRILQILNQGNTWKYGGVKITIPTEIFQQLNQLRCLILRDTQLETLPDSIGNLKLLQFLDLTNTCIERLPESICYLYYLQVLELTNCPLKELPEGIKNMVSLQILNFQKSFGLCIPQGIGNLINLRMLPRFDVKRGSWHCALSELRDLINLKGELFIMGLGNLTRVEEAKEANLWNKIHLEALTLDWSSEHSPTCSHLTTPRTIPAIAVSEQGLCLNLNNQVLKLLRPHGNLKELHIHNYVGFSFPSWLGDPTFNRLVKISLIGGQVMCEVLPSLGQLRYLINLSIQSMVSVRLVSSEFSSGADATNGFQSLRTLEFSDMRNWSEWTGVKNSEFRSLHTLKLVDCPGLTVLPEPLSSSLTKLVITDCGMLSKLPMLPSLRSLSLSGKVCEGMIHCLKQPSLRSLKICQSRNIRLLRLNYVNLLSLQKLIIHGCRNLQSVVGISALSSLKIFKISVCQNLQISLNEKLPKTIRHLGVLSCPKLLSWKRIQDIKYYAQLHMDGEVNEEELELPHASQDNIEVYKEVAEIKQLFLLQRCGSPNQNDPELADVDEYSDQVQSRITANDFKGKQPAELSDSETSSDLY